MAEKLDTVIARMESFFLDYMAFPDASQALVVALWCVGTWVYRAFDAFPYLVITAATKQAGKTRLSELVGFLSFNAKASTAMTPAVMFRMLDAFAGEDNPTGGVTIIYDESEMLSSEAQTVFRQVLNAGYRRGQTVMRMVKDDVKEFPVYCPKCFVLIGDVFDTLRDRSIVITLQRGDPRRVFDWITAESEAAELTADLQRALKGCAFDASPVAFLTGREREIWAPLFSIARVARLDHRLVRAAADFSALKTAPKREIVGVRGQRLLDSEEQRAMEQSYAERAVRDLASLVTDDRPIVTTEAAVSALRAIDSAPWRMFRGVGIDARTLAALVRRFGLRPRSVKVTRGAGAKHGDVQRGYYARDVRAALDTIGYSKGEQHETR